MVLPTGFRTAAFTLASVLFGGCLSASNYGTAKLLGEGRLEVSPSITERYLFYRGKFMDDSPLRIDTLLLDAQGISLAYGPANSADLRLKAERLQRVQGEEVIYLEFEPKFALDRMRSAFSFPVGYYFGSGAYQVGARTFKNFYVNRKFYYCLTPSLQFLGNYEGGLAFSAALSNNLTYEFFQHAYLRPEAGIELTTLLIPAANVHAGIQAGIFW